MAGVAEEPSWTGFANEQIPELETNARQCIPRLWQEDLV